MRENRIQGKKIKVKITSTEISNSFVKIKAQYVNSDEYISLIDLKSIFKSIDDTSEDDIKLGDNVYIARLGVDNYARCRVIEMNDYCSTATVDLIDYGFKLRMNYNQLRILPKSSNLYSIPSICKEFVMAELMISKEYEDYRHRFIKFKELIVNKFLDMEIISENSAGKYVQLYSLEACITHDIIPNHPTLKTVMKRINLAEQMSLMHEQFINESYEDSFDIEHLHQSSSRFGKFQDLSSLEEFQAGVQHEVRISSYENGPRLFYVQSIKSLSQYQDFHVSLQKLSLQPLKNRPKISDVLLAYLESNNVQRIEIIEIKNDLFKVRLIDYGSERMVKLKDLFEIPTNVKEQRPFAWKFCLHQVDNINYASSIEINFFFQYITEHKRLTLCSQNEYCDSISTCTLSDGENSIFDLMKEYNPRILRYPPNQQLLGKQKVKIVYIESPKSFYINVCDQISEHQAIFDEFGKFNSCLYRNLSNGSACCVKISEKNFRGEFETKSGSICQIKLVDIGLIEDFSGNEVKVMVDKFSSIPQLAYKCCLNEYRDIDCDESTCKEFIAKCKQHQVFQLTINSIENNVYYVNLETEGGKNIINGIMISPIKKCEKEKNTDTETQTDLIPLNTDDNTISSISTSAGDWTSLDRREMGEKNLWDDSFDDDNKEDFNFKGIITSIISPNDFTIQCSDTLKKMEEMLKNLQTLAQDECPLTSFIVGTTCTARNPFTEQWCRADILDSDIDAENSLITLRDVDNGQIFSIDNLSELKRASVFSIFSPSYGIRCSLPIKVSQSFDDEATRLFVELTNDKEIYYKIIACGQFMNICDILSKKKSITDALVKMNVATKLKIIPNGPAYVVYIKNLNEFYVQLKHQSVLLSNVQNCIDKYEQVFLSKPLKGMLVMSKSKEFQMKWFRAKIVDEKNGEIEVKYIDFGNHEKQTIADIGMINDSLLTKTPPLAHRCSLNLPNNFDPETNEAIELFRQIADKGYKEMLLRMIEAKINRSIVELYEKDEKNISQEIISRCKKLENCEIISDLESNSADTSTVSE